MLAAKAEDMINTVVRQIAFYTFERAVQPSARTANSPPNASARLWMDVQRESLGPAIELKPGYESSGFTSRTSSIPRFMSMPMRSATAW